MIKNFPISRPFITENTLQALLRLVLALGYGEFLGSNGWRKKIKRRCGSVVKVISVENKYH